MLDILIHNRYIRTSKIQASNLNPLNAIKYLVIAVIFKMYILDFIYPQKVEKNILSAFVLLY